MSKKGPGLKVYCTRTCLRAVKTGTDRLLLRGVGLRSCCGFTLRTVGSRYRYTPQNTNSHLLPTLSLHAPTP